MTKICKIALVSLSCIVSVSASQYTMAATLSNALDFNAFIFNNLTTSGGDTEGRLAVGGNLTVNSSYSVSGCSSLDCTRVDNQPNSQPQSNGTRDDLVVGDDILNSGTNTVSWGQLAGNAKVGGSVASNVSISVTAPNQLITNAGAGNVGVNFNTQAMALRQDSLNFSNLSMNGTVSTDTATTLTLLGSDPNLNIFNITANQWGGSSKSRFIDVPQNSQVVINVSGGNVNLSGGTFNFGVENCSAPIFMMSPVCKNRLDFAPSTLVNFFEATTIDYATFEHEGAFLAPLAYFMSNGGVINGQAVMSSATVMNGFEFHFRANNGKEINIPQEIPEPSTVLGSFVVLGLLVTFQKSKNVDAIK